MIGIVGAGIGGLTAAAALGRHGLDCAVFERTGRLGEVGAGIQLAPNAARVLHRLGLADELDRVAVRPSAIELRRWDDGSLIGRTELGERCERLYRAPYYTIHRADLHRVLRNRLAAGTVRLGQECVGVDVTARDAVLRLRPGGLATVPVAVGADGIHSVVRAGLVTDRPRFSGQLVYRGIVPGEAVPFLSTDPRVLIWPGPGRHAVAYPVRGGESVSFAATVPGEGWRDESWQAPGRVADLRAAYHGWCTEVTTLLAAATTVTRWALHDRDAIDRWGHGRVTLLGDAAHPMLPFLAQGANQAIEDAATLAGCLRHEVAPAALRRYEKLRQERTAQVHELSRRNTTLLHRPDPDSGRPADPHDLRNKRWLFGYDAEAVA